MAEIELTRPTGYKTDRLRKYQIYIDGRKVGEIKAGATETFPLPPGRHELQLRQDWASSETLSVDLGDHDRARFVCAPRVKENDVGIASGLRMIYWSTVGCRRYIDLRPSADYPAMLEARGSSWWLDGSKLLVIALVIGLASWVLTGRDSVAVGLVVGAVAFVLAGVVARGIGKVAVQAGEEVKKHRGD